MPVFADDLRRTGDGYRQLSSTPDAFDVLSTKIIATWRASPTTAALDRNASACSRREAVLAFLRYR